DPHAPLGRRPQQLSVGGALAERAGEDSRRDHGREGVMSLPVRLLDRLDRELGEGAGLVVILDYDGTLTPLVSSPGAAVLAPSVRATLARLAGSRRARLAILSGRGLADLRARVALNGVVYGGCHGPSSCTRATMRRTRGRSRRSADARSRSTSGPNRPPPSTACGASATSRNSCTGWRRPSPLDAVTSRAARPFRFAGCVELRQTLDVHALDERELMHRIAEVPADSIFFHTFGYFLRHRALTTAYGNDFSRWAALEIGDHALAERLAV